MVKWELLHLSCSSLKLLFIAFPPPFSDDPSITSTTILLTSFLSTTSPTSTPRGHKFSVSLSSLGFCYSYLLAVSPNQPHPSHKFHKSHRLPPSLLLALAASICSFFLLFFLCFCILARKRATASSDFLMYVFPFIFWSPKHIATQKSFNSVAIHGLCQLLRENTSSVLFISVHLHRPIIHTSRRCIFLSETKLNHGSENDFFVIFY